MLLKQLVSAIHPDLKAYGFAKTGNYFHLKRDNNWGVINFQKSQGSTKEITRFTINIGTCSNAIRQFDDYESSKRPATYDCHWSFRIGHLIPENYDKWWDIDNTVGLPISLIEEIRTALLQFGIPAIEQHISDNQLIELWLNISNLREKKIYKTPYYILRNLSILLKRYDRIDELNTIIQQIEELAKGKPFETTARIHIHNIINSII